MSRYRKVSGYTLLLTFQTHLFDIALKQPVDSDGRQPSPKRTGESIRIRPGKEIIEPLSLLGVGKVGLEICYDLRCAS